jgi:hypothetical protein
MRERGPALTRASGCSGAGHRIVFFVPQYVRDQLHSHKSRPHAALTAGTVFPRLHRTSACRSGASIHRRRVTGHHPPGQFIRVSARATHYSKVAARAVATCCCGALAAALPPRPAIGPIVEAALSHLRGLTRIPTARRSRRLQLSSVSVRPRCRRDAGRRRNASGAATPMLL